MHCKKLSSLLFPAILLLVLSFSRIADGAEQPVAIFHAFDQSYSEVETFVCALAEQGYSHIQIAPAQKSNPNPAWWARYQPVDYSVIEGRGSEEDLRTLIVKAHSCHVKVIADVVFNHMANMPEFRALNFPDLSPQDFHLPCDINYNDGNRDSEINCWLGALPDLDQSKPEVQTIHRAHLKKLLDLGIDGFRLDAAKHMPADTIQEVYIDYINATSGGQTWNYLEVISDGDTRAEDYTWVAAVTDFVLYNSLKAAFSFGGDLRALRVPRAVDDPRSVTFGRNHDTIREINDKAINPYTDPTDSYLATAYVLARESGTPLVLNWDNADAPYIKSGVKFRQILRQRGTAGGNVKETVLAAVDSATVLLMERGDEGFFVVNKGSATFDVPVLDVTLTQLEGCYQELRNHFSVAVERRSEGKKYVTRWGTWDRGGMEVQGREALYFIREPWEQCQTS
jgi:alpha-amylase